MDIKKASREISYRALKIGNASVKYSRKECETDNGFDMMCIEGEKKVYIGVKATEGTDIFNITDHELRVMQDLSKTEDQEYIIHRYKFLDKKVDKFNIYRYDNEHNVLVDSQDHSEICIIAPIKGTAQYACTPLKGSKKYELK